MTEKRPDLEAWIEAVSPVVKLEIARAFRPGVKANLEVALKMAALIERVPMKDDAESASVFRA